MSHPVNTDPVNEYPVAAASWTIAPCESVIGCAFPFDPAPAANVMV